MKWTFFAARDGDTTQGEVTAPDEDEARRLAFHEIAKEFRMAGELDSAACANDFDSFECELDGFSLDFDEIPDSAKPVDPIAAAAPAMLAALELAEGWIDAEREGEETSEGQQARWILDTIRAAVAAATGSPSGEAAPASPTEATEGEAVETCTDAAAMVRDGLLLLDTVDCVDDSALDDGQLFVVPADGHGFRVNVTIWSR